MPLILPLQRLPPSNPFNNTIMKLAYYKLLVIYKLTTIFQPHCVVYN